MLIDTHTHLYLDKFQEDIDEVITRAVAEDVKMMLLPNIDSATIDEVFKLASKYPQCLPMVGLHPCSVKANYKEELESLHAYLDRENVIAVGEIGMDLYWDKTFEKEQIEAFHIQLDWALDNDLPIVIHSRNAMQECINIVKDRQNGQLRGVFHCFDQNEDTAKQIIDLDFYLGIGGVLTFKKSKLPEAIKKLPLDHIVIETDSPFLTPTPFRGKRNESSYVKYVAEKMAEIFNKPVSIIAEITTGNAKRLFKI
ncbi:MAG: TatD family hydrolase [Saprospiraceae bacterium]